MDEEIFRKFLAETGPVLSVDIGSGTQDALLALPGMEVENWPRFVLPTPARQVAARIRELAGSGHDVWLYGTNMGGGFRGAVLDALGAGRRVASTLAASRALHDCEENVVRLGVVLSESCPRGFVPVRLGDYAPHFWETLLRSCSLPLPHMVLAAAQDHGDRGKAGNRTARMAAYADLLVRHPDPAAWVSDEPDPVMTRLGTLHEATGGPVADTATAALLGVLADPAILARSFRQGITVVNVGNDHVFAALVFRGQACAIYEHHTDMRTREELLDDLKEFRRFFLPREKVLQSGGHGTAYNAPTEDVEAGGFEPTYVIGPRRAVLAGCGQFAAPYGEMMLAGCLGLLWGYASRQAGSGR